MFEEEIFMELKEFVTKLPEELKQELRNALEKDTSSIKTVTSCPKCGNCSYTVEYSTVTMLGTKLEIKDGVTTYYNPNVIIDHCKCLICGKEFEIQRNASELSSI